MSHFTVTLTMLDQQNKPVTTTWIYDSRDVALARVTGLLSFDPALDVIESPIGTFWVTEPDPNELPRPALGWLFLGRELSP